MPLPSTESTGSDQDAIHYVQENDGTRPSNEWDMDLGGFPEPTQPVPPSYPNKAAVKAEVARVLARMREKA